MLEELHTKQIPTPWSHMTAKFEGYRKETVSTSCNMTNCTLEGKDSDQPVDLQSSLSTFSGFQVPSI